MESILQSAISLQINLSPTDFSLCRQLLSTQIGYFYEAVHEVVLTIETRKSKGKKFGANFDRNKEKLENLLQHLAVQFPKLRIAPVDYDPAVKQEVAARFFHGEAKIPDKDYRGGPFYSYFFGLHSCKGRYVIHMDSDMFLGGNPNQWLTGALKLLQEPSVFFVNPLPGPPALDFELKQRHFQRLNRYTYSFKNVTTRFFLTDLEKITRSPLTLRFIKPSLKRLVKGALQRNFWELPEMLFTDILAVNNSFRVSYWGDNDLDGCYSLHPLVKPESFISYIPVLLQRIKANDFPEPQRGWYNVHKDVFDVSRAAN